MAKRKFYAVHTGRVPGVYDNWDDCKAQVDGFTGAKYKSFSTEAEAQNFVNGNVQQQSETQSVNVDADTYIDLPDVYSFVDGSFNPDTGVYGYGGFLCVEGKKIPIMGHDNKADMSSMRNVAGEISGAMVAVKKAEELNLREMTILYDYRGIEEWALGRWRANKQGTVDYVDFMNSDKRKVQLKFQHVKGHTGIEGNEIADVMAKTAVGIPLTKKQQDLYDSAMKQSGVSMKPNTLYIDDDGIHYFKGDIGGGDTLNWDSCGSWDYCNMDEYYVALNSKEDTSEYAKYMYDKLGLTHDVYDRCLLEQNGWKIEPINIDGEMLYFNATNDYNKALPKMTGQFLVMQQFDMPDDKRENELIGCCRCDNVDLYDSPEYVSKYEDMFNGIEKACQLYSKEHDLETKIRAKFAEKRSGNKFSRRLPKGGEEMLAAEQQNQDFQIGD